MFQLKCRKRQLRQRSIIVKQSNNSTQISSTIIIISFDSRRSRVVKQVNDKEYTELEKTKISQRFIRD